MQRARGVEKDCTRKGETVKSRESSAQFCEIREMAFARARSEEEQPLAEWCFLPPVESVAIPVVTCNSMRRRGDGDYAPAEEKIKENKKKLYATSSKTGDRYARAWRRRTGTIARCTHPS